MEYQAVIANCDTEAGTFVRLVTALLAAMLALGSAAQGPSIAEPRDGRKVGSDQFVAGGSVRIGQPVGGDLFAAGGTVDVDGAVEGDAIVAGGTVRIGAPVAHSVYAAGGQLTTNGPIGRNARIAGGDVQIGAMTQVAGNVSVAGGQVTIDGQIQGALHAGGGSVLINGPVDGDVVATAGSIELGPNARIGGKLRYATRDALRKHPAAQIRGGVEVMRLDSHAPGDWPRRRAFGGGWLWTAGLVVLAVVLSLALPDPVRRAAETWRVRPAMSLLLGFVALVCVPVAALILLVTVIGIPLALLTLLLYLALLLVGYITSGIGVGNWALQRLSPARSSLPNWRATAAACGMLAIALLGRLPWLGGVIVFLALLAGIGALTLQLRRQPQPA